MISVKTRLFQCGKFTRLPANHRHVAWFQTVLTIENKKPRKPAFAFGDFARSPQDSR
jgi:hypothetical protein